MRLSLMYTEPSCTPARVAFMTGRQPIRNGMGNTAVDISGFSLAGKEVALAEILSEAGYNTVPIGKWHMGDIKEAWPNFQGFDYAAFPIHQQGQLTIYHDDTADEEVSIGIGDNNYDNRYTMDNWFRTDAAAMVASHIFVGIVGQHFIGLYRRGWVGGHGLTDFLGIIASQKIQDFRHGIGRLGQLQARGDVGPRQHLFLCAIIQTLDGGGQLLGRQSQRQRGGQFRRRLDFPF